MFITEGPVPPEHPLFVGREAELQQMRTWLEEANTVGTVAGARQTGKTSLLLKLRSQWEHRYKFVYVDLEAIYGADVATCFNYISHELLDQLSACLVQEKAMIPATDPQSFMTLLRQAAQCIDIVRIGLILDEIGALPHETAIRLSHTIRAIYNTRFIRPEYARYVFILSGSTDILKLSTNRLSPLRNVTDSIYTVDLSQEETDLLLRRGFESSGIAVPDTVRRSIYNWTSGHPYLTQLIGKWLVEDCKSRGSLPSVETVDALVERIVREEDKNLPHTRRALATGHPRLVYCIKAIDAGKQIRFSRSHDTLAELELFGIIKSHQGQCAIRNNIYATALKTWLREESNLHHKGAVPRLRGIWRGLNKTQRLLLLLIPFTLVMDQIMNWVELPAWLSARPWLMAIAFVIAVVGFIIASLLQAREQTDGGPASDSDKPDLTD